MISKFISNEAMDDGTLVFSDDKEEEKITDELNDFIDTASNLRRI